MNRRSIFLLPLIHALLFPSVLVRSSAAHAASTVGENDGLVSTPTPPPGLLSFPGAEGFGKFTTGGRGGAVYEVTNLADSGPGSFRAAIQASGPRTVVFRVSGTIILNSNLTISRPDITIAGQTAPGDGICLRRYPLVVGANNVIIRYLRMRLGDESGGESDSFWGRGWTHLLIDHCSASWSEDETVSFYWCDSTTIQWCLISESLYNSNHPKGAHGYGGIWGGPNATYHHNLLAHHSSRNPRFASGVGNTDYRNNVIYNWGFNSAYGGEDTSAGSPREYSNINMVANYYKPGPATSAGKIRYRIVNPSTASTDILDATRYGKWHVVDNVVEGYPAVSADNWGAGVQPTGGDAVKSGIRVDTPFQFVEIGQQTAEAAYPLVLLEAGATKPRRDTIDRRIVHEVVTGTATFGGATYPATHGLPAGVPCGIIDSQNDVGGWPALNSTSPPLDSDHDGMPDVWESAHGLNPNDPADRNGIGEGGYTNLEIYLNGPDLLTSVDEEVPEASELMVSPNFPNPFNPATALEFSVRDSGPATVRVYSIIGQQVAELYHGMAERNKRYKIEFSAHELSTGIYIAVLETGGYRLTRKMMLLK